MVKRSFLSVARPASRAPGSPGRPAPAPGRDARGVVVAGTALVAVTYGVVRFGYGLQLTRLSAEFHLGTTLSGLIAAGSFGAYCASALVARPMVDRGGARTVLWLAATLAAAGALVVAVAGTAAVLALGVLTAGSAAGAASPALVVAVSTTAPERLVERRQSVVNAGTGVGVVLVGMAALLAPSAWRPVWVVAAVAAVLAAAVVDRSTTWPTRPDRDPRATRAGSVAEQGGTDRLLRRPVLAAALAGLGSAAVWTFGRDLLSTGGGLSATTTAVLWVLLGAAAVLGALSGDAVRVLGLRRAWVLAVVLSGVSTGALGLLATSAVAAGVAAAVFGGCYTAASGVLIAWAGALRPDRTGSTTASLFVALTAGQAVGSLLTGALTAVLGGGGAFVVSGALLVSAAVVLPPRRPGDQPRSRLICGS